jgi:hypothetical protein
MKHTLAGACAALFIFPEKLLFPVCSTGLFKCGNKQGKLPRLSLYPKCGGCKIGSQRPINGRSNHSQFGELAWAFCS